MEPPLLEVHLHCFTTDESCGGQNDKMCDAAPTSETSQNGWTWCGLARLWRDM